jgi:lipid-A-disaccharide synthase
VREFAETSAQRRERRLVALLPGSRLGAIEKHLPTLLEAVAPIKDIRVVIPAANDRARAAIDRIVAGCGLRVEVQSGGARELLLRADVAAVASGTATLEAALARCPTVLVYKVSPLLAAFLRRAIKGVKHAGLANIIAEKSGGECPMPELLQEEFTAEATRAYLEKWLSDESARADAASALDSTVRRLTCDSDPYALIAHAAMET